MKLKNILPNQLGFGAAPLGNMFRDIPEAEAAATVEAAWKSGVRYYDNAPFYGAGLAEIRMGEVLSQYPRDEYVISTKVGRIILDEVEDVSARDLGEKGDAIHARHLHIQHYHVGPLFFQFFQCKQRIRGGGYHLDIRLLFENGL